MGIQLQANSFTATIVNLPSPKQRPTYVAGRRRGDHPDADRVSKELGRKLPGEEVQYSQRCIDSLARPTTSAPAFPVSKALISDAFENWDSGLSLGSETPPESHLYATCIELDPGTPFAHPSYESCTPCSNLSTSEMTPKRCRLFHSRTIQIMTISRKTPCFMTDSHGSFVTNLTRKGRVSLSTRTVRLHSATQTWLVDVVPFSGCR